ncbi:MULTISPECIES: class I fructose-bisphosphate aldolase [Vagococcus]|uniref:class I fructose-bisphosphate aldolase n=1 Tax=Vagococcus TaxID=2737 RepID=UPI0013145708|nr:MULTISPECIES: class I fructose-bisphosphate aldolase [Vagococcus]
MLDEKTLTMVKTHPGFIAAMDQGDLSTPGALRQYGVPDETYQTSEEMHNIIHDMRTRMIISDEFSSKYVLGVILYKDALERTIFSEPMPDYLWNKKGMLPFLKIDQGLAPLVDGVQQMAELTEFDTLVEKAKDFPFIGFKFRSLVCAANEEGIKQLVKQQFDLAKKVYSLGYLPMLEPDIDLHIIDKKQAEIYLKEALIKELNDLDSDMKIMLKLTLPSESDFYHDLLDFPQVVRMLASSSGLRQTEADKKLSENHDMIASFSRALTEGLSYQESDMEFDFHLRQTLHAIFDASNT